MTDSIQGKAFSIREDADSNSVHVVLDHRKEVNDASAGKLVFGETNTIWCSRQGIVRVEVLKENDNSVVYSIVPSEHFDERRDYVVSHLQYTPDPRRQGGKHYEVFKLLVGKMPAWASFPQAWYDWVRDEEVHWSAVEHIKKRVPGASLPISHAASLESKNEIVTAWLDVAAVCSSALKRPIAREEVLRNQSWTSVYAMPMKIAKRLGGWSSPVPEPRYEHPDRSGRVLVASPNSGEDMLRTLAQAATV